MLEWYEAYADYKDTMERIENLLAAVARETTGTTKAAFRGYEVGLASPWQRLKLVDALEELGLWTRDEAELRARLEQRGVDTAADRSWGQLLDHALSHFVEPELIQPTILYDYPVELSPFARRTDDDPAFTERFEYFAAGMGLGNAYSELTDPDEQAARFAEQGGAVGGPDRTTSRRSPTGCRRPGGLGLGIDRLAMLLTGRETIRDVILFPALRERSDRRLGSFKRRSTKASTGASPVPAIGRTASVCPLDLRQLLENTTSRRPATGECKSTVPAYRPSTNTRARPPAGPVRETHATTRPLTVTFATARLPAARLSPPAVVSGSRRCRHLPPYAIQRLRSSRRLTENEAPRTAGLAFPAAS